MTNPSRQPFERDPFTILTYGMAVAFGFALAALGPAMPLIREDLDMSRTLGGLHFTALAAGSVLAGFSSERLTARWGRRLLFWAGGTGVAAGAIIVGAGWHPAVTLIGSIVVGTSGALMLTTGQAALSDHHPLHRPVALTEVNTAMSLGAVVPALLIGGLAAAGVGWRAAFLAPLGIWIVLAATRRTEPFPAPAPADAPAERYRLSRSYWIYWAALIPAVGAEWSIAAWGAGFLVDVAGTAEATAALLMMGFFGAMVAGRAVGARIARQAEPPVVLATSITVATVGALVLLIAESAFSAVIGLVVAGLGISMLFPMLLALAMSTAPGHADAASARAFIAGGSAVLVAPLTLGVVADTAGIRAAFGLVPALLGVLALLAVLGWRTAAASRVANP
ncbi:MAG: MFS transporter [Acidimicrobiia bacterium]|nr:MAG: MFS transporter [Acidimicrobiia bacterium]